MSEYEYIKKPGAELPPFNEEVKIQLRNPDTMELFNAKAIIHPPAEAPPEGDVLFFTAATTGKETVPHPLEIMEVFEDEVAEVEALPSQKLTLGQRKGTMLMEMIKGKKDKKG